MQKLESNRDFKEASYKWMETAVENGYYYQWNWQGVPIIHLPQDVMIIQSIIFESKPKIIVESGIARGGSLILHASLMSLSGCIADDSKSVIGIDLEIREHTHKAIRESNYKNNIEMIEASSISQDAFEKVKRIVNNETEVLVCLDSCHTHDHVLSELELYSDIVGIGQYLIVYDTVISYMPDHHNQNRDWSKSKNPMTAVNEFLEKDKRFIRDEKYDTLAMPNSSPRGILRRIC